MKELTIDDFRDLLWRVYVAERVAAEANAALEGIAADLAALKAEAPPATEPPAAE